MSLGQALESSSCRGKIGLDFGLDRHWVQVGLARFDSSSGGSRTRLGLDKGEFIVSVQPCLGWVQITLGSGQACTFLVSIRPFSESSLKIYILNNFTLKSYFPY